nr:immunoglobulin heavy chain junction region [Mus musculus]
CARDNSDYAWYFDVW